MNKGLEKATGEYIGIVESDDFADPNMFEELYAFAKNSGADAVKSNYYEYKAGVNSHRCPIDRDDTGLLLDPARHIWIFYQAPAIWSGLYRREFLLKNKIKFLPTPGASYQDTGFNFKVWATTHKAYFTYNSYLHYRTDNESSSVNSMGKVLCVCEEYAEIEKYLKDKEIFSNYGELMMVAKFGAYYWNLFRLSNKLLPTFIEEIKKEYKKAFDEDLICRRLWDDKMYNLLTYILSHSTKNVVIHISSLRRKMERKKNLRIIAAKIKPAYRKQVELAHLLDEIQYQNILLEEKVSMLKEEKNRS